jgi:hypothetical protein
MSKDTIIRLPNGDAVSARSIVQVRSFNIDDDWYVSCTSSSGPPVSINYCCERDAVTARDKLIRRWEEALADDEPEAKPAPSKTDNVIFPTDRYQIVTDPFHNLVRIIVADRSLELRPDDAHSFACHLLASSSDLKRRQHS